MLTKKSIFCCAHLVLGCLSRGVIDAIGFKRIGWMGASVKNPGKLHRNAQSLALRHRGGNVDAGDSHDASDLAQGVEEEKPLVIVIDVDNTLYSERHLQSSTGDGIESQIVKNTHLFGLLHFNLTPEQCDDLYRAYGSTIEGLRQTLPPDQVEPTMARFYKEVYDAIDHSCLLGMSKKEGMQIDDEEVRSGYDHGDALKHQRALAEFLKALCKIHPVYLASNSPKAHILRVINNMGLGGVDFAGVLSPDMDCNADTDTAQSTPENHVVFPTKSSPGQYYKHILDRHPPSSNRIILLDDSLHNIREAESVGIQGVHIHQTGRTLEEGLSQALGHILPTESNSVSSDESYAFSDVDYLVAKNQVDKNSINPDVWEQLALELALRIQEQKNGGTLRIADLGAGMLSMLDLIMNGGGEAERTKPSMLLLINKYLEMIQKDDNSCHSITKLEYFAYESNLNLLKGCKEKLHEMGFREVKNNSLEDEVSFKHIDTDITVHLRPTNFQAEQSPPEDVDLIIGCCFADLFDPSQLVLSLQRFANGGSPPLVYFPITFAGLTQFDPASPQMPSQSSNNQKMIPSDTSAFRLYSESLTRHGHNLDPSLIVNAISDHGGALISEGTSDWIIDPDQDHYLWKTMLYFFGMSGAREVAVHHLDALGWIKRCRSNQRRIIASNVDLLFHMHADSRANKMDQETDHTRGANNDGSTSVSAEEIQFVAPYNVTTVTKNWDTSDSGHLSPNQVEIESLCSLISSGTELKIFKGSFESAALDVNIKGMADESMEYPLAYGYSLVGRVVACGSNVEDAESLMGKLVFTFSPHSTRVITDRDAIQLVPDGIDPEDAIFMPSVETALSLVHDAHVRLGENVAVYGQGLIGLLVTSLLSLQSKSLISTSNHFGSVTAFDVMDDRLSLSSSVGATSALKPSAVGLAGPFDVSIEVSGNPRALQSAIDNTSNNGRIIVGSWYGNTEVALKLGIDFHRSHKTIQTSQVSTIPPALAGLWPKNRRFSLTWALVKSIRPSRLITKRLPLTEAQQAYELLDGGKEIAVCFKYD